MLRTTRCVFCASVVALWAAPVGAGQRAPTRAALAEAARRTLARLRSTAASWTASHVAQFSTPFVAEVVHAPARKRVSLSVRAPATPPNDPGKLVEALRIISRDGAWYLREQGRWVGKYRPYEAPPDLATAYVYLLRSELRCVPDDVPWPYGECVRVEGTRATCRQALPDHLRKTLEHTQLQLEALLTVSPERDTDGQLAQTATLIRKLLTEGLTTTIDTETGILVEYGTSKVTTRITNFRWLETVDDAAFVVPKRLPDHTDDPMATRPGDQVVLHHCGVWDGKTDTTPETDARLVDVKTLRMRRVPFRGALVRGGCFTRDRTKVIGTGLAVTGGALGLYEIDLKTGRNRQLGGDTLRRGACVFPRLSPDGKTIALLHKDFGGPPLQVQVVLLDRKTGRERPLGRPLDTGPVSWLGGAKGLILVTREYPRMDQPSIDTICRMDLEGRITPIRRGGIPRVLADGVTILFHDSRTKQWKTCDLEGKNERLLGDGFIGHGFPAPARDGRRLLMMHFGQPRGPQPVVISIADGTSKPLALRRGLWGYPAWR